MIDPTFSSTQQQAIKDQFNKWKNAGGANVTFNFVEPSQAGGGATTGGPPIVSVMRQIPDKKGATAQGETEGFSYNGNRGGYVHRHQSRRDRSDGLYTRRIPRGRTHIRPR